MAKILRWKPEFAEIFELKTFFFNWYSPFPFNPHSQIHINKLLEPPLKFISAPQSRSPGAGPAITYKIYPQMQDFNRVLDLSCK